MDLKEIGTDTRNWVDSVPQEKDYWRALVNATLNSGFHKPWSYSARMQYFNIYPTSNLSKHYISDIFCVPGGAIW
jgi:hypothetical protein